MEIPPDPDSRLLIEERSEEERREMKTMMK
jgi:hypothetical protein